MACDIMTTIISDHRSRQLNRPRSDTFGFLLKRLLSRIALRFYEGFLWRLGAASGRSVLILGIAGFCLLQLRSCAKTVYAPIALLIACVISFLLVQVVIHDISILDESYVPFIIWILQLIIVHSLCLRRGFSLRYPLVLFFMAVAMLPFLTFDPGEIERAHINRDLGVQGGSVSPRWHCGMVWLLRRLFCHSRSRSQAVSYPNRCVAVSGWMPVRCSTHCKPQRHC